MKDRQEIHAIASAVHGALVVLHGLGVLYNWKRKHWLNTAVHAYGVAFSLRATRHHMKEVSCTSSAEPTHAPWEEAVRRAGR